VKGYTATAFLKLVGAPPRSPVEIVGDFISVWSNVSIIYLGLMGQNCRAIHLVPRHSRAIYSAKKYDFGSTVNLADLNDLVLILIPILGG
jgi:hypothetical protein